MAYYHCCLGADLLAHTCRPERVRMCACKYAALTAQNTLKYTRLDMLQARRPGTELIWCRHTRGSGLGDVNLEQHDHGGRLDRVTRATVVGIAADSGLGVELI
jgi:hypothetical protein